MWNWLTRLLLVSLACAVAHGASVYVRDGGTGDGSAWDNALDDLPASLTRGTVYYLADGSYAAYTIDDAESGADYIIIRKATAADHGTETGWISAYGDGQAEFPLIKPEVSYVWIDGVAGAFADWHPEYVAHGIKIHRQSTVDSLRLLHAGVTSSRVHHQVYEHIELCYDNTPEQEWFDGCHGIYLYTSNPGGAYTNGVMISGVWAHNMSGVNLYVAGATTFSGVVERSVFEENGRATLYGWSTDHSELLNWSGYSELRYNIFRRWRSTGGVCLLSNDLAGYGTSDYIIHGNLWTTDMDTGGGGAIKGFNDDDHGRTNVWIFNNTFANIPNGGEIATGGDWHNLNVANNLFSSVAATIGGDISLAQSTNRHHNWYYDCGTFDSDVSNQQNGTADPFVNAAQLDFRLSAATLAGDATETFPLLDPLGITRGADGTWDRGAYEYDAGADETPPVISAVSATPSVTSATVTWTTDENSTSGLEWGLDASYGSSSTNSASVSSHSLGASGLDEGTVYHFRVHSTDASGNSAVSDDATFETDAQPAAPAGANIGGGSIFGGSYR